MTATLPPLDYDRFPDRQSWMLIPCKHIDTTATTKTNGQRLQKMVIPLNSNLTLHCGRACRCPIRFDVSSVLFQDIEMPVPVIRGIGPVLDGRVGRKSKLAFGANGVLIDANIELNGTNSAGKVYKWTGKVANGDIKPHDKVKMDVTCQVGDTMTFRRGRNRGRGFGAGDIIDVTFTITNPQTPPATSPEVVEIG